jgi:hypothetical protein
MHDELAYCFMVARRLAVYEVPRRNMEWFGQYMLVYVRELVLRHSVIFQWIKGEHKAFGQVLLT